MLQSPPAILQVRFDVTALDLQPAHFSVLKGDFLRVGIVDKRGGDGGDGGVVVDKEGRERAHKRQL